MPSISIQVELRFKVSTCSDVHDIKDNNDSIHDNERECRGWTLFSWHIR